MVKEIAYTQEEQAYYQSWFKWINTQLIPWVKRIEQDLNTVEKRVTDGESLDAKQEAALQGLVKTAIDIQKATEKTES
jgi:hypothetical protein